VNCFYFNVLEEIKTTETETETAENINNRRVADTPVNSTRDGNIRNGSTMIKANVRKSKTEWYLSENGT
jgi:hypothetical protein